MSGFAPFGCNPALFQLGWTVRRAGPAVGRGHPIGEPGTFHLSHAWCKAVQRLHQEGILRREGAVIGYGAWSWGVRVGKGACGIAFPFGQ